MSNPLAELFATFETVAHEQALADLADLASLYAGLTPKHREVTEALLKLLQVALAASDEQDERERAKADAKAKQPQGARIPTYGELALRFFGSATPRQKVAMWAYCHNWEYAHLGPKAPRVRAKDERPRPDWFGQVLNDPLPRLTDEQIAEARRLRYHGIEGEQEAERPQRHTVATEAKIREARHLNFKNPEKWTRHTLADKYGSTYDAVRRWLSTNYDHLGPVGPRRNKPPSTNDDIREARRLHNANPRLWLAAQLAERFDRDRTTITGWLSSKYDHLD